MTQRPNGMPCPIDGTQLVMSERQGIEIDYCPTCRGVWLDRGELDKIIERNAADNTPAAASPPPQQQQQPAPPPASPWGGHPPQQGYGHPGGYGQHGYPYRKRKKSFLEELFD